MTDIRNLLRRAKSRCELCGNNEDLSVLEVPPSADPDNPDHHILVCPTCREQIEDQAKMDPNHWRCLNDSMWSQVPAVQVMAWRMLTRLSEEGWPLELLDILYLDDETLAWAKATGEHPAEASTVRHLDANGVELEAGDTVTLTKDLNVKGAGFTAKRGTPVRNINLVPDDPDHIEGRVNDQQIVLLAKFVKKSSK